MSGEPAGGPGPGQDVPQPTWTGGPNIARGWPNFKLICILGPRDRTETDTASLAQTSTKIGTETGAKTKGKAGIAPFSFSIWRRRAPPPQLPVASSRGTWQCKLRLPPTWDSTTHDRAFIEALSQELPSETELMKTMDDAQTKAECTAQRLRHIIRTDPSSVNDLFTIATEQDEPHILRFREVLTALLARTSPCSSCGRRPPSDERNVQASDAAASELSSALAPLYAIHEVLPLMRTAENRAVLANSSRAAVFKTAARPVDPNFLLTQTHADYASRADQPYWSLLYPLDARLRVDHEKVVSYVERLQEIADIASSVAEGRDSPSWLSRLKGKGKDNGKNDSSDCTCDR